VTIAQLSFEIKLTNDLYLKVGQLLQSVDDLRGDLAESKGEAKELRELIIELRPIIEQAARNGADWERTKKKGLLWLAGVGASGITIGTYGGKPFLGWLGSLLPLFPK
jgi:hypothetical protein